MYFVASITNFLFISVERKLYALNSNRGFDFEIMFSDVILNRRIFLFCTLYVFLPDYFIMTNFFYNSSINNLNIPSF